MTKLEKTVVLASLFLLSANFAWAGYIPLRTDMPGDRPQVDLLLSSADQVQFEVRLPGVDLLEGTLEGRRWDRVEIPGGGYEMQLGAPEVPHFTRLVAIPATAGVRAEFEALESTTLNNIQLMPAQGLDTEDLAVNSQPVQFDMAAYSRHAFYPDQNISASEPAVMRGVRLVALKMNPVQYNPVTRELRLITRYRVTVHFEGTDLRNVPRRQVPLSHAWSALMRSSVLNFDDLNLDSEAVGSYLIVCENDATLQTNLQPLIDWKKRKGHTVTVQTFTPAASATTIKNLIQTAYDTWEIPPEYVLLFGDTSGDYPLPGWSPDGIDHPYAQLEGGDILADVAVGRLPAENAAETATMVNKVLFYEKMPYTSNTEWFHQSVLTAGSGSGTSTIQTNRWIKTRMVWANYTRIDTMWYTMGGSIPTTISGAINNGVTYFNYRGYLGISGWDNGDIDALSNGRKLPFCTVITCGTGGFDGDSNMEHFVSVGTPTTPKGAIASVGTATWSTNTRCNNTIDMGIYAGLFDEGITQVGNALNRGKLELWYTYQANSSGSVSSFSNWNALAGDPGLDLFTGAIQYLTCDVPATTVWGENSLALTVNQSGNPLEGATVCLYKSGELQEVAVTDAAGQVELPLNPAAAGNVKVTITKHNYYPLVDSLDVTQQGIAVGYLSNTVDDNNTGGSSGDGDGIINPGETVELPLIFKNFGSSTTATNVSVTAVETDDFASLIDNVETFPNLAPGATGNSLDDFDVVLAPNCPHGHVVRLNLNTTCTQGSWDGLMDLEVISYLMDIRSAVASGSDTLLSPGETANLILSVRNEGGKNAAALTATIVSLDTLVIVNDNAASFGTVNIGSSASCSSNPFNLTAAAGAPLGHMADMAVTFSANGATQTDTISLKLGNKTQIDPQGPDEYGYYCYDNTDVGYAQAPIYNWIEIDPNYGGSGLALPISDTGEDQDASALVTLPFAFRYYGADVSQITVCSNGWIATTSDISYTDFRNYPIPSAIGPTGHICAFWDDLYTWSGGRVYAWNDAANHRFIIEWSRVKNLGSPQPQEIFEIILPDPVYYSTPTGDGEIIFQYNSITEVTGVYDDHPYSTVGIENPNRLDGLEVVYWSTYEDPAAAPLANGRAYRFTTAFEAGGEPPVIGVNPTSLTINVPENGSGSSPLSISNTGGSTLTYSINFTSDFGDALGGPDNFGYTWMDSDEPGGPQYSWVDISAVGTPITFAHNDSTCAAQSIGFDFPFYGQMRSTYIISANGWISFTSHSGAYNNTTLPNSGAPFDLLAAFWDDLDPLQTGAQVRTWNNGTDSLVVSFLAVPHWGSSVVGTYTFQWILTADGDITYQYQTLTGNYANCTVGQQNQAGTDGLQMAYNQTYLHNSLATNIAHPFLQATPPGGAVPAGGNAAVLVSAYGYGLATGTYPAQMIISSNDPATPQVTVPITVQVGGGAPSPVTITMTPINPPIEIPASGGSFSFDVSVANVSTAPQTFDAWIMVLLPTGSWYGPTLGPVTLTLPAGGSLARLRSQSIPGSAPAGAYTYRGYVGDYATVKWDSSSFGFTKLTTGDGPFVSGWENTGESFAPWIAASELPAQFAFRGCSPNPFNPVTAVLFDLPTAARVEIRIFDALGRQVALLQDGTMSAGTHNLRWEASGLASGVYFLRFRADDFIATNKLLLLK